MCEILARYLVYNFLKCNQSYGWLFTIVHNASSWDRANLQNRVCKFHQRGERGWAPTICCLLQCNNCMWPNEAGRSQVQTKNQASWERAYTLQQICGSFPQLSLAPKLISAVGWGTWTSQQHENTLYSWLTFPTSYTPSEPFYMLKFPLSKKEQGNFSEFQPILSSNSLWFCFWGTASLWVCPLMKSVTGLFSSDSF